MSKNIELHIFGQVLRLNCPEEQQASLREAAARLEQRVGELKERTGILQMDRILAIVALNLTFELQQEKQKNLQQDNMLHRIQQHLRDKPLFDSIFVTCSIGVTGLRPDADLDALIHEADELMYQAKKSGGDCICRSREHKAEEVG